MKDAIVKVKLLLDNIWSFLIFVRLRPFYGDNPTYANDLFGNDFEIAPQYVEVSSTHRASQQQPPVLCSSSAKDSLQRTALRSVAGFCLVDTVWRFTTLYEVRLTYVGRHLW
jgi:hypothetical protein